MRELCQNAIGHVGLPFIPFALFDQKSNNYLNTKRHGWRMDGRKGRMEGRGYLSK